MRFFANKKGAFLAFCLTLLAVTTAQAQVVTNQAPTNYDDQLALDVTPIPAGLGALFVPSLASPGLESKVVVYHKGEKIADGRTAQRIVLPPGEYEVYLATGSKEMAAHTTARVVDGVTVIVQPFYGSFQLDAVDERGNPIAVSYALDQDGERLYSDKTNADEDAKSFAYLLPPGPKTLKFGDGTEVALFIPKGEKLNYRAVFSGNKFQRLDYASNKIDVSEKWWRARWTLGADLSFNYSKKQLANFNGMYAQLGAFTNAEVGVDYKNNLLTLRLNIDEAWLMVDSEYGARVPLRSLRDNVSAEFLYAYRLFRVFGPFLRASAETSLMGTKYYAKEDVEFIDEAGTSAGTLDSGKSYKLLKSFAPLFLEEAGGVNFTVWDSQVFDLVLLGGVGARQHYFADGKTILKEENNKVTYRPLINEQFYGAIAEARMGLRLGQNFRLSATGKMFVPHRQILKGEKFNPIYSVEGLAELAINSFASIVYRGSWQRNTLQAPAEIFHGGALRLQHNLF